MRKSFGGGAEGFALSDKEVLFLRELVRCGTKFLMVGMAAANLQGADKGTRDINLWFKSTSDGGLDEAAKSVGGMFIWKADPPLCPVRSWRESTSSTSVMVSTASIVNTRRPSTLRSTTLLSKCCPSPGS